MAQDGCRDCSFSPLPYTSRVGEKAMLVVLGSPRTFVTLFILLFLFFPKGTFLRVSGVNICGKHLHLSSRLWRGRSPSIHLTAAATSIGLEGKIRFANKYPRKKKKGKSKSLLCAHVSSHCRDCVYAHGIKRRFIRAPCAPQRQFPIKIFFLENASIFQRRKEGKRHTHVLKCPKVGSLGSSWTHTHQRDKGFSGKSGSADRREEEEEEEATSP